MPLKAVRNAVLVAERAPSVSILDNALLLMGLFVCERLESLEISQRMIAEAAQDPSET